MHSTPDPMTDGKIDASRTWWQALVTIDRLIRDKPGLENCARCGGSHESLDWHAFSNVPEYGEYEIKGWAMCPTKWEPILFSVMHAKDD